MKKTLFTLLMLLATCGAAVHARNAEPEGPKPAPRQMKWHEAELGVVFHYDLHVFDGQVYGQGNNRINPIEDYNIFHPDHLDTDQWIQSAKAAGAKFAILTATHETGFGLWQSDVNPYCLKAVKWHDGKGDIVRDFVNSCRKYGLQPGIYIGIRWNSLLGIHNFKAEGEGEFARNRQAWYKRLCEKMVKELCTRYGDLFMIWFDGGADDPKGLGPDVEPIVNEYQPDCLFYHNVNRADLRWGGSESGTVGYPCWSSFPYPYSHSNATLMVGLTPNPDGLIPEGDVRRLKEWGAEINRRFGQPLAATSATGKKRLSLSLDKAQPVNYYQIQEDLNGGERIRAYRVEAKVNGKWTTVAKGSSVGHKRIESFPAVEAQSFRLVVEECTAEPLIRNFSVYHVTD